METLEDATRAKANDEDNNIGRCFQESQDDNAKIDPTKKCDNIGR